MRSICNAYPVAYTLPTLEDFETKFIIDAIMFPQLIVPDNVGYLFFRLHERLAKECCKILIKNGVSSATQEMDDWYFDKIRYYTGKYSNPDEAAAISWTEHCSAREMKRPAAGFSTCAIQWGRQVLL